MYDLIIIGGGPAGVTAGIYAARQKLKTLVLAKDFIGQTGEAGVIQNWPGEQNIKGAELAEKFENHLKFYDVEIKEEEVVFLDKIGDFFDVKTEEGSEFRSKAVILATGRKPKKLNIPGEKRLIGKGVVFCTICDAFLFQKKTVVVAGGGDSGFKSAIELLNYTKDIYLFELSSELRAEESLQEEAKKGGVKVFKNREIKEVKGEEFVEEIDYIDAQSGEKGSLKIDGLFVQIGSDPITNFIKNEDLIDFNKMGDIETDPKTCETKTKGLFAAGDVTDVRYKQIVIATGEGAKAALSAYEYIKNENK